MSLIVQMCMCVCFHGCFCVPFFMLPTPYCPYIILPKCPKSSTHFQFSLFYFVNSPVQTKPQMFMFSPYPNISAETLGVALDSRRRRKCLKYFQHACYTTFPVYLGKLVFLSLLYVFLLSVNSISVYIFFCHKSNAEKTNSIKML